MPWRGARSAPFFGSRMNHHRYGCQTQHPPGCEPHSLVPKLAEIGWGSCKAGGITLYLSAEEHPNRSCRLAGTRPALASSPWLGASVPGKLSSSAPGASRRGASIAQTLKVIKHPRWMSHRLRGGKPVCKRRSCWEKGPEGKGEISGKAHMSPATAVPGFFI